MAETGPTEERRHVDAPVVSSEIVIEDATALPRAVVELLADKQRYIRQVRATLEVLDEPMKGLTGRDELMREIGNIEGQDALIQELLAAVLMHREGDKWLNIPPDPDSI